MEMKLSDIENIRRCDSPLLSGGTIVIISIESLYTMIFYKSLDYVFLHIQDFLFYSGV